MLKNIHNHPVSKISRKISYITLQILLLIILPIVVFTFLTSKTSVFNMQSFMVLTGSMHPTIDPGSMVYVRKEQFYNSDDIISFTVEGGDTVTHRVVRSERNGNTVQYITKGDANTIEDKNAVPADKIIGKVFVYIPYVGHAVNFLKTPNGFIAMIVVPISLFIAIELWNIKRELERQVEKKMLEKMQELQQSTQLVSQ